MIRNCSIQVVGLAIALVGVTCALGQSSSPATTRFNPYVYQTGPAANLLSQNYTGVTSSSTPPSLNQVALRNAQTLMMNSLRQPSSSTGAARIGLGAGNSFSGSKPFSGFSQGPTVSPYLNLFRVDLSGNNALNYQTLVEPQLRQQQLNQQIQQKAQQTNYRLQAIAAQADFNPQGSREEFPTGHQTVFMYYGHYYPVARPVQKKR
jgi:hypothetical protein